MYKNLHFKPSPAHREQLYAAVESGRVGDRPVRQESLIPLRVRFDTLLEEFKIRRETLLLIQAHYRILSLLEELETKMERWKTGDSLLFFSQWLDEYHNEEATEPKKKFDLLVHDMKVKIPTESDKLRTEGMLSLQEAESMGEDVLSRFRAMRELLESLIKFWREFETNARRVEEHLTLCEMDNSELKGETKALFKNCERLGDQICIHATGAQPTITARVTKIRQRMEKIRRSPITGYVTNIEVPLPSTSRATSPGHEPTSQLEDPLMKLIKETRLGKWMKKARVLLSKKISTVKEATTLMNEFVACQKEVAEVEVGRSTDLQGLKDEEKEKINKRYRALRAEIPTRIDLLKMVHPMLSSAEKYLTEIEAWIVNRDPFSEMGKKSIRERAEIVDQVGFMLDALEKPEFTKILDCAPLRKSYANVKHSFVLPTKTDVAAAIQEVEKLKTRNEAVSQRIDSLKQKFELTAAAPGPNRVEELLERKAAILSRQEDSVEAIKASIIEMNMVNEALILHNATNNQNYTSLQRDWLKKLSHMDRLMLVLGEVNELEKRAQKEKKTLLLRSLLRDADSFIHILNQIELDIPLLEETKRKLAALRQLLAEKHKMSTSVSRSQIGERIKQLEMTPEEDLPIAAVVVKEIVQEAVGLYRKDESEESKQLVEESERVQQLIDRKMDFFRRLQQFYDRIKELQRDNSHWNAITFSKIDSVLSGIDARLKEFHDELKPEEQWLAHELESIEGNFFQLEADRVKEKFRVLIHQMTKQSSLMEKRKEFLTKLQEFNAVLEKTKDTLSRVGRDAQQGLDIRELTNELTDLQSSLQRIGDEVCTTQATAQMNVTDWNIEHAIQQLQQIAIPSTVPETSLHRLVELSQRLGNLLSQSIPKFDTTSPLSISDYIRQLLNLATQEQALVDEIKRSEEQIPVSQLDNQIKDLIQTQQQHFHERMSNREVLIDAAVAATIFAIRKDIAGVDKNVDTAIYEKDALRIQSIEETDWRPVKDRIGELERSLEYDIIEPLKNKWTPHIADLQLIAFNLDGKIRRFRATREKEAKKHAKIVQNLAAFAKWLDLVETDMKNILQNPDLTHSIRESSLIKLKDNLEQHMRLATKLESYPFEDQAQAEFARRQCAKHQELMETLNRLNLPVARLVPIRVETELPSTSAAFGSQLSITSTSSIASEFEKRPEDEARDELGRALETVQHEATRIEIIQEAAQISTRVDEPDKIHELIQTAQAHEVPPPMSDIEQEVQNLINSLKAIRHSYDKLPLKFADQAKEDVDKLKSLTLRANNAEKDLSQFARNVSDRERPRVTRLLSDLQLEHVACERLIDGLIKEIEDELELRINYTQIMSDLTELETEVRDASKSSRTPETKEYLDRVEVKLDVLKRQCRRPRRYIASSIEQGERSASPTRRRRIILKITNTVTTIIKVVEEELRKHSPPPGASTTVYEDIIKSEPEELIELHRTLQRVHKTIEEVISPPCTPTQTVAQKADIDRLVQQAVEIRDSIESLMKHPEQFYSVEQYDMPIRAAQEGRSGLEKVLRQFDESEDPIKVPIEERNRVIDIIHSLLEIEEELEDKKKQSENRSQEYEECIAKIRDNIKDADSLLSQERPSIENVNEIRQQTSQLLQRSEEILREPETALQLRSELELAHDQLNLLDEKIQDKEKQLTSTDNSIDEAYRLMDIIKNALEQELSDAPFTLEKGINKKNNLEGNNQKVQRLKELCDQLEGAPITNILKAAAQEYEDAEGRINNEIESEKQEVENNKGLQEEFDLIEDDENGLMVLNIMEESINAKKKEPLERRYIISSTIPFLQNMKEKIKHKRKNITDKLTNNAKTTIDELKLMKEIPEEAIERALLQLENLPKDQTDVEQLQKELEEVRSKKEQLDSLKRRLNDELNEVAEKLQRVEGSTKTSEHEKPRKKKGKKQPTVEHKPAKRKERIQSLNEAINELDNQIIPKLAEIQKEALDNELDVAVLEPQQQKATKLVEALN
uniref:KASH domain-containing protein n=1 Tax=Acrobeloides nanus TaxID=290746 RepID=A0A914C322_9BILA